MSYTADEVRALIDHWETHRYSDPLWIRVRYADLNTALGLLPPDMARVVTVHGLLRWDVRSSGEVLGVSKSTVSRRYNEAVEWIANYLSGVDTY